MTQTTTYVNGSQEFRVHWDVHNITGDAVKFKALAAADFYFQGDDSGPGSSPPARPASSAAPTLTPAPPAASSKVTDGGVPSWSAYEALPSGAAIRTVWGKIEESADSSATFDDSVLGIGRQRRRRRVGPGRDRAPASPTARPAPSSSCPQRVPAALQLNPTNAGSRQGVPINITATRSTPTASPYAGKTLRYSIAGPNAATGRA